MKPLITVICPVFNEEKTIPIFYRRVAALFEKLDSQFSCNLLFVDNCSTDSSLKTIHTISEENAQVFYLGLSKNVGYQKSMEAGLRNAVGDFFVIIDVDCEDPPEMVAEFVEIQKGGIDIVYGERVDRSEPYMIKTLRKVFYRFTRFVSDEHFFVDMAEFCLITSEVRDAIIQDMSSFPFIRASIGRVGFEFKGVPYKRSPRVAGKSNFNFSRMIIFAVAGILSSSTLPLRSMVYTFPLLIFVALLAMLDAIPTTVFTYAVSFYLSLGIMFVSIYVARIYKDGLGRPNAFLVQRKTKKQHL
jgi:glycosyltransferase involved in cell wall biosynthesis